MRTFYRFVEQNAFAFLCVGVHGGVRLSMSLTRRWPIVYCPQRVARFLAPESCSVGEWQIEFF
jgi:hypothetical protein